VRTLCQHWSENNSKQSWYEIESCVYLASLGILVLEMVGHLHCSTNTVISLMQHAIFIY